MSDRDYYVTMIRDASNASFPKCVAWLAGPFPTHDEALALVDRASALAQEIDLWAAFDAFGTSSLPRSVNNPIGKLNAQLGK